MSKVYGVFPHGLHAFVVREGTEDHRGEVTFPWPWRKQDARVIVTSKALAEKHAARLTAWA